MAKHKVGAAVDDYTLTARYGKQLFAQHGGSNVEPALDAVVAAYLEATASFKVALPDWITNHKLRDMTLSYSKVCQGYEAHPEDKAAPAAVHRYWFDHYVEGVSFELWCKVYDAVRLGGNGTKDKEADKQATVCVTSFLSKLV